MELSTYRYFGIDKNIRYVGAINKQKIVKENYHRIKKIWNSDLSSLNKVIAHKTFAVSAFIISAGIFEWAIEGGRGIKSLVRMYGGIVISVTQHLELRQSYNTKLQFVAEKEQNDIIRLKEKLLENYRIE